MEKFQNKYRIPSSRLQNWNYSWDAAYFITICTHNRHHYFGSVVNGKMELSNMGIIANVLCHEIKNHTHNLELDAFQVMPNHLHGILILNGNKKNIDDKIIDIVQTVETGHALSLQSESKSESKSESQTVSKSKTIGQQRFQNIEKNSISSIIGSYKSAVTKHANRLEIEFGWQTRFHDHIIRNDNEFQRIQHYIINNPAKWKEDKFY